MKKVISTTAAPAAIGPYSQAIEIDEHIVYVSGQLPVSVTTGELAGDDVKSQTAESFKNIRAILSAAGYTIDQVVKTTVFLADMSYFADMNSVYATQFTSDFPARSTVAVKGLPKGALVEIEVVAMR